MSEDITQVYLGLLEQTVEKSKDSSDMFFAVFRKVLDESDYSPKAIMTAILRDDLYAWRRSYEEKGLRAPCLEADPTPFLQYAKDHTVAGRRLEDYTADMAHTQAVDPAKNLAGGPVGGPAYITFCKDPNAPDAVKLVTRTKIYPDGRHESVEISQEDAQKFLDYAKDLKPIGPPLIKAATAEDLVQHMDPEGPIAGIRQI